MTNKDKTQEAAEEYFKSKNPNAFENTPILISAFAEFTADFHIHQTKKMLEARTDEKIMDEYWEDAFGIMHFRDELLKQLEK